MISDITATAEVGKTYLGKVTRLADFGAFVEIIPGTDGLLHISEVAEHRINDVRDELKEGDQVLVKVLAVEGNRIKLSRKAILKEQRAKMGGGEAPPEGEGCTGGFRRWTRSCRRAQLRAQLQSRQPRTSPRWRRRVVLAVAARAADAVAIVAVALVVSGAVSEEAKLTGEQRCSPVVLAR